MGLAALIAPLLALFLVRKLLKSLGLGDLMKIGSAAMLPMAGAMKMGGEGGRIGDAAKSIKDGWNGKVDAKGNRITDKEGNRLARDKGLSEKLGLDKLEPKALAGYAATGSKKAAAPIAKKLEPTRERVGERVASVVGRKDANGNLIESGVVQRVLSLNSMYHRAKGAGVPGVNTAVGQGVGSVLAKFEKGAARGKVDEMQRQQRIRRIQDSKIERKAKRDLGSSYVPGVASQKAAAARIAEKQALDRLSMHGSVDPVALSERNVADNKLKLSSKNGIRVEDLLIGHDGTTAGLNVSRGLRPQDTPEATASFASDPRTWLPTMDRVRREGESDGDYLLRQTLLAERVGLIDPVTGEHVDMLVRCGIDITNKNDLTALTDAALQMDETGSLKGTRFEDVKVNVTAADRAAVDGAMREIKAVRTSEQAQLVNAAKVEFATESNAMVGKVNAAPGSISNDSTTTTNILNQIAGTVGILHPQSSTSMAALFALNETLSRIADTLGEAGGEGAALLTHKEIVQKDEATSGGVASTELANIMERLDEQIRKLNTQKQADQQQIANLMNAIQNAVASGDKTQVEDLKTQVADFISVAEARAVDGAKSVNGALDKARTEAEKREDEREQAEARFTKGPYRSNSWTDNRGAGFA